MAPLALGEAPELTREQAQLVRQRGHLYQTLTRSEQEKAISGIVNDVWGLENPDYYWGAGPPSADDDSTYGQTRELVYEMLRAEGAKDLRHAVSQVRGGVKWTAFKVFVSCCMHIVHEEIEHDIPMVRNTKQGHFKYYSAYKSKIFKSLHPDHLAVYESLATQWNKIGASDEVKESSRQQNEKRLVKNFIYMGARDFNVYYVVLRLPGHGSQLKPEIFDFMKELGYSKYPLSKFFQWQPTLNRLVEYSAKSMMALAEDEAMEAADPNAPRHLRYKLGHKEDSHLQYGYDQERRVIILPTDDWQTNREQIMKAEHPIYRELFQDAWALLTGIPGSIPPWTEIGKNPELYLPAAFAAPPEPYIHYSKALVPAREHLVKTAFELGEFGFLPSALDVRAASAVRPRPDPAEPMIVLPKLMVTTWGSFGWAFLADSNIKSYPKPMFELEVDESRVLQDRHPDPAELLVRNDPEVTLLSPASTLPTTESRCQLSLAALYHLVPATEDDRKPAIELVREVMEMPSYARYATTDAQIARDYPNLVPPVVVSWKALTLLFGSEDALRTIKWLVLEPWTKKGLLGWSQTMNCMLAVVMFLVSESARKVRSGQLTQDPIWDMVMGLVEQPAADVVHGGSRTAFSDALESFLNCVRAKRLAFIWTGFAPAQRYRISFSRVEFLSRVCQADGFFELLRLIMAMPDAPVDAADVTTVAPFGSLGSWELGRGGMPSEFHEDPLLVKWEALKGHFLSERALCNAAGNPRPREAGYTLALKMAMVWQDIRAREDTEDAADLPQALRLSNITLDDCNLVISEGITTQVRALRTALAGQEIPPAMPPRPPVLNLQLRLRDKIKRNIAQYRDNPQPRNSRLDKEMRRMAEYKIRIQQNRAATAIGKRSRAQDEPAAAAIDPAAPKPKRSRKAIPQPAPLPTNPQKTKRKMPEPPAAAPAITHAKRRGQKSAGASSARPKRPGAGAATKTRKAMAIASEDEAFSAAESDPLGEFGTMDDIEAEVNRAFDLDEQRELRERARDAAREEAAALAAASRPPAAGPRPRARPLARRGGANAVASSSRLTLDDGEADAAAAGEAASAAPADNAPAPPIAGPSTPRLRGRQRASSAAADEAAPLTPRRVTRASAAAADAADIPSSAKEIISRPRRNSQVFVEIISRPQTPVAVRDAPPTPSSRRSGGRA